MRDAVATGSAATPSIAKTSTRPSYALRHASSLRTTKPRTRYCLQLPHRASISGCHRSQEPRQSLAQRAPRDVRPSGPIERAAGSETYHGSTPFATSSARRLSSVGSAAPSSPSAVQRRHMSRSSSRTATSKVRRSPVTGRALTFWPHDEYARSIGSRSVRRIRAAGSTRWSTPHTLAFWKLSGEPSTNQPFAVWLFRRSLRQRAIAAWLAAGCVSSQCASSKKCVSLFRCAGWDGGSFSASTSTACSSEEPAFWQPMTSAARKGLERFSGARERFRNSRIADFRPSFFSRLRRRFFRELARALA